MKQRALVVLLFGTVSLIGRSQQVVTTSGGYFESSSAQVSWTLGEIMINTLSNDGVQLTQGQQQTRFDFLSIPKENNPDIISVYPNPVIDQLTINTNGDVYHYIISNTAGQIIQKGVINSPNQIISTLQMSAGLYALRIFNESNESIIKLIKQ